ncbi:protein RGF1 INDUCIBLE TRANSCRIPTION FACTOR 1-like [Syzygium oleosum]|uniref:protein RGF1 INDUCIBLE TRANSCRIPTION FACTOR 1-like n=1 Tax=Syzygium oleosum TaxID=219896 RepID=UPI0024BA701E|nr:protein RGF1 INDUCIBLE TRANSCRIPTION FACTOR 1-like [Syzygium oleosum]
MTGNDAMMVSPGDDREKVVPLWLRPIASAGVYSSCETHRSEERNFYCRVCMVALCKECKKQHDLSDHEMIKAYKVGRDVSFRMDDLKYLWDISDICQYTSNKKLVAFIRKRGDGSARSSSESGTTECESCQYRLKSPGAKYCSVECKVEAVMKMNGSGSMNNEAKKKVEAISEGSASASNVQSFRKRPRKQKHPRRAPLY